jgi:hypothetical protein
MMQGPDINPDGGEKWGTLDGVSFDPNREHRVLNNEFKKHELNNRINSAELPELVEILRESFENGRTQTGQYGCDQFGDSLLNLDLRRVRNNSSSPRETAKLPGEHFTPREFEALLQRFLETGPSELNNIRRFAINMNNSGSGLTNMTKRIERFQREIPDNYFSDVSPQDLIKLANFYSPKSPEAPVLYEAMTAALVEINQEKNPLQVRLEIANTINNERLKDFLQAAALLLEKDLAKRLIDTATPADEHP